MWSELTYVQVYEQFTAMTLYCLAGPAPVRWALNTFGLD